MATTYVAAALILMVSGCTPLGVWVYDDPSLTLRSATLRPMGVEGVGVDSLDLVFASCNRNDYDLLGEEFATRIRVDGHDVGEGRRDQPYRLATRDSAPVTVTLALQQTWIPGETELPVEVESDLLVRLPKGERRFAVIQRGTLVRQQGAIVLKGIRTSRCLPGRSSLPGQFTRPVGIGGPEPIRPTPRSAGPPSQP
jgi:hypothetical protein